MNLPELSIRRPITILMLFLGIALIGSIALKLLPVEMMPNTSFGQITINIDVRGGIPAPEIEKRVTKPVEEAVGTVSHLRNMLSISKEGNAMVILEFDPGTNMDFAALEVREKFNRIRNHLPPQIEKPVIAKYEYNDIPIMILAVTSPLKTPEQLRTIVDDRIRDAIQRLEGIGRVEVVGGREEKILIEVDQNKLRAYSLSVEAIINAVNISNINILAGQIKKTRDKYIVRAVGEFRTLKDIENLPVTATSQGSIIRIKDLAVVKDSYLDPVSLARVNIKPAVSIYIQKESLANTLQVSRRVQEAIEKLKPRLDKDISITPIFSQAEYIKKSIKRVEISLFYGSLLATLILMLFMRNIRTVFVIVLTIPLSLLFTFTMMFFSKISLNVITLSGLALGVGMLLDTSVVVLENIFKKREADPDIKPAQAAIEGANEMVLAIIASTFTTLIVFTPLLFISPEIRSVYSPIGLTITFSLLASLLVSLTLVPMLSGKLRRAPSPKEKDEYEPDKIPAESAAGRAAEETTKQIPPPLAKSLQGIFSRFIDICLFLRYIILAVIAAVFFISMHQSKKIGKEFIGLAEHNKFTVFIEMPTGTKLEVTNKVVKKVEHFLEELRASHIIKNYTSKIEPWSSKIYVETTPLNIRKISIRSIIDRLREKTSQIREAFIYYEDPSSIETKEIFIEIYGHNYTILKKLAEKTAGNMQRIKEFRDVKIRMREGRPEVLVNINRNRAALFGLSTYDIALALHTKMRGLVATRYHGETKNTRSKEAETKEIETIARLDKKYRRSLKDVNNFILLTPAKNNIYLNQVASFKQTTGPSEIWRKNKARMVQVSADIGSMTLEKAAEKTAAALKQIKFPSEYFWKFGENYDKMVRTQKELKFALGLSILLIYMVLAALFESFSKPFVILLTVPLAAIGVIAALQLTNKPISTGVLIGAVMLGGIVVNNAIILIDRINYLNRRIKQAGQNAGAGIRHILRMASQDRIRPILITSLTTILGLIPMALDKSESSSLWSPLATTVIGGMIFSTFLTLIVIPGVYLIFNDLGIIKDR